MSRRGAASAEIALLSWSKFCTRFRARWLGSSAAGITPSSGRSHRLRMPAMLRFLRLMVSSCCWIRLHTADQSMRALTSSSVIFPATHS